MSRPTYLGGLGFGFKWNMGWMHDTLDYFSRDPIFRRYHHNDLTFGLVYAWTENFVLPISHDEVVHGKGSLLGKMPGDRWQQLANLRALFAWMWAHPGKQLLFMGGELAQLSEWSHDRSLDWYLLHDPAHVGIQTLVRSLNAGLPGSARAVAAGLLRRGFSMDRRQRHRQQRAVVSAHGRRELGPPCFPTRVDRLPPASTCWSAWPTSPRCPSSTTASGSPSAAVWVEVLNTDAVGIRRERHGQRRRGLGRAIPAGTACLRRSS